VSTVNIAATGSGTALVQVTYLLFSDACFSDKQQPFSYFSQSQAQNCGTAF